MWKLILQWLSKKACKHQWELENKMSVHDAYYKSGDLPREVRSTYMCKECGEFKQVVL